ncbi:MAG: hypothetical protein JO355_14940 [Planctomycetaceae bacterium]|nr:hypothetical protein [Planctomycetaceae bacterium]
MQDRAYRAEIEQKRLRILEADKAKQARMKEMMDRATTAYAKGEYDAAEKYATMAQEIDPNEVAATILAFKAKMERRYKRDLEIRNQKENAAVIAFQEADAASIANPEAQLRGIAYAKDFKDLTRERLRINAALEPKKDSRTLAIEAKLKEPVSVNMDKQPLKEAIDFLANYTGLNLVLDPKALSDAEVSYATPVTLTASNIQLKTALKLMLRPLGLTYKVEDEVLMITSPQSSLRETFPKTYYVGDLIIPPGKPVGNPADPKSNYNPQTPTQTDPNRLQAQTVTLANGATSIGGGSGATATAGERPKVDMTPLIQLITATIAPGTWRVNDLSGNDASGAYGMGAGFGGGDGGGLDQAQPIGSITPFFLSISLIIRHTAEIHDQIADLLRQLRRLQDLQVSIEVRFITLSDTFFEYIAVNFDFDILSKTVGKHSTFAVPNPATSIFTNTPGLSTTTGTTTGLANLTTGTTSTTSTTTSTTGLAGQNGGGLGGLGTSTASTTSTPAATPNYIVNPIRDYALGNRLPLTVGTSSVGAGGATFTPNLAMQFLQGSGALAAPTTNIPGAGATFGIAFLSDLEVYLFLTAAQGDQRTNILQAPKVTTFNGAPATIVNTDQINFVESLIPIVGPGSVAFLPTVASFPNGVQLLVTPVVSADRRYVRMTLAPVFTVIESFTTIQVPAAVGGSGLGGGSAAINGTIQLPQFNFTTVSTTVTVPDGGTVLLGGVKRLNEERQEFGVPVLSKTPLINRLFRNIGISRVTSSLMLMVTPRIIILEEEEERLGIPTVTQ